MVKTTKENVELLAPAGSYDAFIAAVNAGADAVYMGVGKYNARTMATNLSLEEYIKAIDYAHKRNVKVYLTLNTLLLDSEIKDALELVLELYKEGLDAVILQDLGMATLIHKFLPDLPLHASTQMSVCNLDQVKYLEKLGFTRVVLGRELSIKEIENIAKNTKVEIEVFVHGALCVCFSGQCMASSMIGDRSANRGSCAQPCRMKYSLYTESEKRPLVSNRYLLSKKDIFGIEHLQELLDAGVKSFKIEGRNKTVEYTAGTVSNYRRTIDNAFKVEDAQKLELLQLFNRSGQSDGYLKGVRYKQSISETTPKNTGLFLGKVLDKKQEYIKIKLEQDINLHDGIEIVTKEGNVSSIVTCIRDDRFNIINEKCEIGQVVYIGDLKGKLEKGAVVYKTSSDELNNKYAEFKNVNKHNTRLEYNVVVRIVRNKKIQALDVDNNILVELDCIPEASKTTGVTVDKIEQCFTKTEDSSVVFKNIKIDLDENLFVPVSKLNELRRNLVDAIERSKIVKRDIKSKDVKEFLEKENKEILYKIRQEENNTVKKQGSLYMYRYNKDVDYIKLYKEKYEERLDRLYIPARHYIKHEQDILKYIDRVDVYIEVPNIVLSNMDKCLKENLERLIKQGVKGILLGNLGYVEECIRLKEKYNIKLVGNYTLNIANKYTASHYTKLDCIIPIFETDEPDLEEISKVKNVELVEGVVSAMTTRYCMLASFVKNADKKGECKAVCKEKDYYILDTHNKKYNIITDSTDCITELVRNKRKYNEKHLNKFNVRRNIL